MVGFADVKGVVSGIPDSEAGVELLRRASQYEEMVKPRALAIWYRISISAFLFLLSIAFVHVFLSPVTKCAWRSFLFTTEHSDMPQKRTEGT